MRQPARQFKKVPSFSDWIATRQMFEKWAVLGSYNIDKEAETGHYLTARTQGAWDGWQAAWVLNSAAK